MNRGTGTTAFVFFGISCCLQVLSQLIPFKRNHIYCRVPAWWEDFQQLNSSLSVSRELHILIKSLSSLLENLLQEAPGVIKSMLVLILKYVGFFKMYLFICLFYFFIFFYHHQRDSLRRSVAGRSSAVPDHLPGGTPQTNGWQLLCLRGAHWVLDLKEWARWCRKLPPPHPHPKKRVRGRLKDV